MSYTEFTIASVEISPEQLAEVSQRMRPPYRGEGVARENVWIDWGDEFITYDPEDARVAIGDPELVTFYDDNYSTLHYEGGVLTYTETDRTVPLGNAPSWLGRVFYDVTGCEVGRADYERRVELEKRYSKAWLRLNNAEFGIAEIPEQTDALREMRAAIKGQMVTLQEERRRALTPASVRT